jgi:hypothetical protein
MDRIMQKSAHTNPPIGRNSSPSFEPRLDKGQKFEPFWTVAFGSDRRSQARLQKADQKR